MPETCCNSLRNLNERRTMGIGKLQGIPRCYTLMWLTALPASCQKDLICLACKPLWFEQEDEVKEFQEEIAQLSLVRRQYWHWEGQRRMSDEK